MRTFFSFCLLATLTACAGKQISQAQINQAIANANALTAAGCALVQPGLSVGAQASGNADAQLASTANAAFCAGVTAAANKAATAQPASGAAQ